MPRYAPIRGSSLPTWASPMPTGRMWAGLMLRIEALDAWYGEARVLRGVTLDVPDGEVVTLVGRNGAGKTTLLRCVAGLHRQCRGTIQLDNGGPAAGPLGTTSAPVAG